MSSKRNEVSVELSTNSSSNYLFLIQNLSKTRTRTLKSYKQTEAGSSIEFDIPFSKTTVIPPQHKLELKLHVLKKGKPSGVFQFSFDQNQTINRSVAFEKKEENPRINRVAWSMDLAKLTISPQPNPSTGSISRFPFEFRIENLGAEERILKKYEQVDPGSDMEFTIPFAQPVSIPSQFMVKLQVQWKEGHPKGAVRLRMGQFRFEFEACDRTVSRFVSVEAGQGDIALDNMVGLDYTPLAPLPFMHFKHADFPILTSAEELRIKLLNVELKKGTNHRALLEDNFTTKNYESRLTALLHEAEEFNIRELSKFDLRSTKFLRFELGLLFLTVPGLAEKRPSVMVGDNVKVKLVDGGEEVYGGVVIKVGLQEIGVLFHNAQALINKTVHVRFVENRFSVLMCHRAIRTAKQPEFLPRVFPLKKDALPALTAVPLPFKHDPVFQKLNAHQQQAVETICFRMPSSRVSPFLLFGPPGTGKTTTLVAAIALLVKMSPQNKILVSCGSNSACDHIFKQLKTMLDPQEEVRPQVVVRYFSASLSSPPHDQKVATLVQARIIVSTCVTSGKLSQLPSTGFSHIFLDEAAQSTEQDSLIPLALNGKKKTQFILGGDFKQLGPVILSPVARNEGKMDISLFERLFSFPPYALEYDPGFVVQLTQNYRSHADILSVPSKLFYRNTLQSMLPMKSLCQFKGLPKKNFPLIVHHVAGLERRENTNPSWFNLSECVQVVEYVKALMADSSITPRVDPERDIAIIAPYLGHARKLETLFKRLNLKPRIGSVEFFQGKEARIVIVSTCRSSSENRDVDAIHHLGFLNNAKRMNVALTRAKELLILVGNVTVLKTDACWEKFILHCEANKAVVGMAI